MDVPSQGVYSARAQDCPQEMEIIQATANHVAWLSCAWLLLSFFLFPVGHPMSAGCTVSLPLTFAPAFLIKKALFDLQAAHNNRKKKAIYRQARGPISPCERRNQSPAL